MRLPAIAILITVLGLNLVAQSKPPLLPEAVVGALANEL